MPLSRRAVFQVLSSWACAGGAVSAMHTSTMSGNCTLTGAPSMKSTGSRMAGLRNRDAGPMRAAGMATCS